MRNRSLSIAALVSVFEAVDMAGERHASQGNQLQTMASESHPRHENHMSDLAPGTSAMKGGLPNFPSSSTTNVAQLRRLYDPV